MGSKGFVADLFCCEYTVHTAVVKFDALPYSIGSGADDEHFLFGRDCTFVFLVESGVEVGCLGGKLAGTGVYHFIHTTYAVGVEGAFDVFFLHAKQPCNLFIAIAELFDFAL